MEGGVGEDEVVSDMEAINIDDESDDESRGIDEDEEYSAVELTEDVMLQESHALVLFYDVNSCVQYKVSTTCVGLPLLIALAYHMY